jgi:ATP-dependent RNA helicase HelY
MADRSGKFTLDRFQSEALDSIDAGKSVLVSAPTGSGKTVVAEHALTLAMRSGQRAFYTTPIKALSNQKYHDLCADHGAENVGLLTGDTSINGDAPIVVMTTEVLRNMIYSRAASLERLGWVVLDEVHYLQDAYRGPVWEEVIIHLPQHVRLVCLSATVSNAAELAEWIGTVRGPTDVVVEDTRPVTLDNWFLVEDTHSSDLVLLPTLVEGRSNPDGARFDNDPREAWRSRGGGRPRRRYATPRRVEVIELLEQRSMLPAIYFIFSRAACNDAAQACVDAGLSFTTDDERELIREIAERHVADLGDDDLRILEYDRWLHGLQAGIACHHAGMIPPFKEAVEACFLAGLVKVVFATETLALGVNMPARTVVIEKLMKFTGETHEFLTAGQYTQLTGRAGRRGIDNHGHAVVLWSPFVTFEDVATLAASKSFRLTSSFRPTYNMAANLVRRYDAGEAHRLLTLSFAQFQADAEVVRFERRRSQRETLRSELVAESECELGDVRDYRSALEGARHTTGSAKSAEGNDIEQSLQSLKPGDVLWLSGSGGNDRCAVISVSHRKGGQVRVNSLTANGRVKRLSAVDFTEPAIVVDRIALPVPFTPSKPAFQKSVARLLADSTGTTSKSGSAKGKKMHSSKRVRLVHESHPVHRCPDRDSHLRALRRLDRLERELTDLDRQIKDRSDSLAETFDRVLQMLEQWNYLDGWTLTERGEQLVRIYHEADLLVAEALELGLFDGLDASSMAGAASSFIYEHRNSGPDLEPWFPNSDIGHRIDELDSVALDMNSDERRLGLPTTRRPDAGFFALAHAWAAGDDLERILADDEMPGGDFVRTMKQLIDLLRQIGDASTNDVTSATARRAADDLFRGVVAASSPSGASSPIGSGDDSSGPRPDSESRR